MPAVSILILRVSLNLQLLLHFGSLLALVVTSNNFMAETILQYDAFDIGFITTDDFTNADILEATYPAVAKRLHEDWISDPAIPVVTGFLGKVSNVKLNISF